MTATIIPDDHPLPEVGVADEMKRWRPRFSIRTACVLIGLVGVYFGGWRATREYGIAAGSAQLSPMPLILTEDSRPHYQRKPTLVMEFDRTYSFWFFGDQHEFLTRKIRQEFAGLSRREQSLLMRENAIQRRDLVERSNDRN